MVHTLALFLTLLFLASCQVKGGGGPAGGGIITPPNPAYTTTISGTTNHIADNTDTSTITITVFEGPAPVAGVIPTFAVSGSNNLIASCSATNAGGTSTCFLRTSRAEVKSIQVLLPNISTTSSVTFFPGPASTASTITSAGPVTANGTSSMTLNVSLKDASGNFISGVVPTFDATNTSGGNSYGVCTATTATGASICTMRSTRAEVKTLRLTSPVTVSGGPAFFFGGPAVAANSSISGTTPHAADGVDASTVSIGLYDAFMNPAMGIVPTFNATGTGNTYTACSQTSFTGIATCSMKSTVGGVKTLSIQTPFVKAGSPVTFNAAVGVPVAANSNITGTSPVIADGVATSTVTITLRDAASLGVPGIIPTFSATNTNTGNSYGVCSTTNASGVSTCTLASTGAETKTLMITGPITKSDGTVVFIPGPPSSVTSTITGTSPVTANGSSASLVSINIKDAFNNPIPGQTPTFSATDTGMQNVYGSCSVTDAAGLSTCTLASTFAETKTLQLLTPVTVTGGIVVFTAGVAVAANSNIVGTSPKIADGVDSSTVTITLRDINNNPVSGQTPTFGATNTGTTNAYGACSVTNASGVSTCSLTSLTAETKTLSIATPVIKADGTVIFTAAGASVANSSITGTSPVVADGTATSTVTITLKDSNNNPIAGTTPTFSATDTGTSNSYGVCPATNASGVSICTLTSTKAENKTLSIASPIIKADGTVLFIPGTPSSVTSTITGSSPVVADGTATSTVSITINDAFNNPITGQTPTFSATDTGMQNVYGSCSVTDAAGLSTCTLASTIAETKTLQILTPVIVTGGTVVFTAGVPVAANSNITGTTPVVADGTATSSVSITLNDVNNNPVSGVTPTFSATDTGTTNTYGACSASNASGVSTCTLASTVAETKTLSIATPFVKAGSNVVFTAAGAVAANSNITGTGPVIANGSATSTVTITLRDANNNPVPGETPTFGATDTGTTNSYGSCSVTNASGVSTCTMTSLRAETKTLAIATPVVKADGTVIFTAGIPVAANSNITGSSPVLADGSATSTISITLRDANNNPVPGETPTFGATDTGATNVYGSCSVSNASGVSTCSMTSLKAETKTLAIATPVVKADGTVIFTAGTPVAANSNITGTTPVVADGSATSTVSITLADVNNNLVSGVTPTFSATDTGTTNTYGSCSASNASGVSTCTLASTVAETKTLSIATPFVKAGGNVVFTAAGAVAANSNITGSSPVIANGSATSTVTITLRDSNNNPVPGETPTFGATDTGTTNAYGSCSVTNASGVSTCTMTSLKAETKTLAIATPVVKADGTVVFTAGTPVASNSNVTGTSPVLADGSATSTVTITLRDANNNFVSGQTPTFGATDTGSTNAYGSCSITNASGVATCTMTSLKAETKILSIATPVVKADGTVIFTAGTPVAANSSITGTTPVIADGSATSTVTITLADVNNNLVSGVTPTFTATNTGTTNTYGSCSASNASGVSICTLASTVAETKTLSIATPFVKAGTNVVFTSAGAVAANSNITGSGPVIANGSATSLVTITLRDSNNNPVSGQTPTFGATDTGTTNAYGSCSVTNASGVSTCTMTSQKAEIKTLAIATPVVKPDGTVTFTPGAPSSVTSTITGSSPVVADGAATSTISISIKDAFNNVISGQTPTFSATDTGMQNVYGSCSVTDAAGLSSCTLSSTIAETKTLQLLTPVIVVGGTVVFTAGAPVAANSTITGTSPVIANGSATSTVTITLADVNNNFVSGVTPTFSATNTGTTNSYGLCSVSSASGISTCTLASTVAETKTLSIATPFVKAGSNVVFTAAGAVAANSTITGTGPVIANGSATSTVTITLRDSNNNPVPGETPTFGATNTGTTNAYGSCSVTNASGISTCTLASLKAETKTLSIATPVVKADGTVVFTAGSPVAANSNITGSSPVLADGSAISTITISLRDANNNTVAGETPTFGATDTGATNAYGSCSVTNASGISTCTLTSLKAETKTLSIATPVVKADGTVIFTAGTPVAANSTISGTTPVIADGSATSTVTITLADINNNFVSGVTPTFSATNTGTTNSYGLCSASNASGVSTCTLASTFAETKTLSIATPFVKAGSNVVFTSAGAVAANSTITGTGPVIANGSATSSVTITLRDSNNNPVSGETPTFGATDTGTTNGYGSCSVTNASGISTCTMTSLRAETKILSIATPVVKADGTVVFTAGTPIAANSNITGSSPVIANGSATSTITITLRDANNNTVAGQTPTFGATDTGTTNSYGSCSVTNASGVSTCSMTSLKAETKTLAIATPVVKADGTVIFTAGTPVAANSSITGTTPVIADGSATSTVTMTFADVNNNLVSGVTPTFTATDTGTSNAYGICSVSNASGVSTCTLSSTVAETKTLSIATPFVKAGTNVIFTAAGAVAANSTITGTGPVIANGSATSSVTITLRDANNNPVPAETPTFGATDTGTTNAYGSCSVSNASGVSTCTMTSLKAETKTLSIATPVVKADGTVVFTAGTPVAANSNITGTSPIIANGSATSTVTITLRDANNNTVAGQTPTFGATDTGTTNAYGSCSVSNASGVSTCSMTSLKAETKTLAIATPVVKADGTVIFTAGSPVAANSSISGTTPVIADGSATSSVTITLADVNNNLVSGVTPTFSATDTGTTNTYGSCSASNASGVSICTLASTVAETKTLSIATPFVKAGTNVIFTAAGAVAANSTITGSGPVIANGSATSTVTITLRDANNNAVAGQTPTFGATDTGTTNAYGSCSLTNASGVSTCTLTSLKAETKTLSIATPVVKADGTVIFTAGATVAANSNITGSSPVVADGSATSTITITLRDTNNNTVSGQTPTFGATDTGTTNAYGSCSVTNASGVSTCTMTSLKAESKTLSIATPIVKADGTVIFTAGTPVAANSTITGTGPVVANGSATSTVTITLADVNNNLVSGVTPTFSATNTGTTNSNGVCSATNASGVSTCTLSSLFAEVKTLSIATPVSKVGGTVTFTAAAAVAANSNITGTGPVVADGTATSNITITLRDGSNNPVSGQTPTFSATNTGTTNGYGSCSVTNASGVSTCTLNSLRAETKTLSITAPVTKADGTVVFTAGTPVAANSNITGSSPVIANGSATSTITITLRDANSNTVSGQTPTFGATDTGTTNAYGSCSVTNASGVSTCTMTSLRAETKTLSIATPVVKADGTVIFTAGTPVAANSTITGTGPVIANGSATSTVTINLRDVNNNPVSGETPTFSATNTGTTNVQGSCSATNASGDSTCTLSSLTAETKTLSITAPVSKTGGTVVFTAGTAVAANSNITGTGPVIANGVATSTVTITLRDGSNNPVIGITPTFSATDTGTGNTYQACSATNSSGVSTCTMRSTKSETKTLSIVTPVSKADGTVVFTAGPAVAANSNVTGSGPVVADNVATSTITVTLRDANSNPVPSITPVYAASGTGNTVVACGPTNALGDATCSLRSTRAQIKTLSITSPVTKTGGTVTFIAGSPSSTTTTISGTTPVSADGVSTSLISITILDVNSNPISGTIPIFNATDTNTTNVYGACAASDTGGLSLCTLASTKAEFKTLQLTSPVGVTGSVVEFSSSLPVSANSTIAGTSPHAADGVTDSTITITLRDGNNNPVAGIEPSFAATNTGSGNTYDACSLSDAGGVSTCTMQSTVAETKTLQITAPVTKSGGTVTFTAGVAVAANSLITGTGPIVADNTATSTVTVTLRDAFNNGVAGQTPTFTTSGTGNTQTGCSSSNASGVSTCTVKSTKAEVKTLAIATPVSKTGGTVTFTAGIPTAATSTITGTGPTNPDGVSLSTITITLKDANSNNISGITPTFSATGTNNSYNSCSATNASGVSTCTMTSTTAETKTLSIVTPVSKTDGTVVFASGSPSVANSSILATGPVIANGVATSTVTITLKDNLNAPVIGTVPTFLADGSANTYNVCSATNASGVSTCTMTSTMAESKTVSIATPIIKAGNTIVFTPGPPSATASTIACDATKYLANGTDVCNITVTIRDANNNAISGTTPTISVSGTSNTVSACSMTDFAGLSTCTLSSTKAEGKFLSIVTPVAKTDTVEYEFNPNGINLQVPIEMADRGLLSTTTAGGIIFSRTRTAIDPAEYEGTTTQYFFEINAANSNTGTPYTVQLVNDLGTVITDSSITVPISTTATRRFRVQFTPSGFADAYRVKIPATATASQLRINSARIIVVQTGAVKTKVWVPLIGFDFSSDTGLDTTGSSATTTTTTYNVSSATYYNWFSRNDANFDAIPTVGGWTLDVVLRNSQATGTGYAALYNKTTGQMVAEVSHTGNLNVTSKSVNINSNAANFVTGNDYELRIRSVTSGTTNTNSILKAGLWIKLKYLKRTEVHWRLSNRRSVNGAGAPIPDGRFVYEAGSYSNPTATFFATTQSSIASGSTVQLLNTTTSDTATTGTATHTFTPTTTFGRQTSAVTLTDTTRYMINHVRTSGTATIGGAYIVIRAQE